MLIAGTLSSIVTIRLGSDDVKRTFSEVNRVLKPGGELLLMVVNPDIWVRVALPFLRGHGYFGGPAFPRGGDRV